MRYIEMTTEQRQAAFADLQQAFDIHADAFTLNSRGFGSLRCAAYRDYCKVEREMGFLLRVAKSRGDAWAAR